jgi:hypothetical protein
MGLTMYLGTGTTAGRAIHIVSQGDRAYCEQEWRAEAAGGERRQLAGAAGRGGEQGWRAEEASLGGG